MHNNDTFFAKVVDTRLTRTFVVIFAFLQSLPTSATLCLGCDVEQGILLYCIEMETECKANVAQL